MADNKAAPKPSVAPESQGNAATAAAPASTAQRPQVSPELAAKAAEMAASVSSQVGAGAAQGRAILLPNGMRRVDYIKARWSAGVSRGQIVKELKAMGHETVSYQIVFAATKDAKPGSPAGAAGTTTTQATSTVAEPKPAE